MSLSRPISLLAILLFAAAIHAQDWPNKISGYKVHDPKIVLTGKSTDAVEVKVTGATIEGVGLTGTTINIEAEILSKKQGIDIESIRFRDIRVNGVTVEPAEYRNALTIKKGESKKLPVPVSVVVPVTSHPKAFYDQIINPRSRMKVTGTVFIFGKFKKFGFSFKRVAPVTLDLDIENPIQIR